MSASSTPLPQTAAEQAERLAAELESRIQATGRRLYERIREERPSLFESKFWKGKVLDWSMRDDAFKVAMFRFVDVFPALRSPEAVAQHVQEYFGGGGQPFPEVLQWGIETLAPRALGAKLVSSAVRSNIESIARQFILERDIETALPALARLREEGLGSSVSLLGEAVISEKEADEYTQRCLQVLDTLAREQNHWKPLGESANGLDWGASPRVNVSVKPSALYSQTKARSQEQSVAGALQRLRTIARRAVEAQAFVYLDMEHRELKNLTLALYRALCEDDEFRNYPYTGLAMQAYLREAPQDVDSLLEWAAAHGHPLTIRLVKGAYWDAETVWAQQHNWPLPVYQRKSETDAAFERLAGRILEAGAPVRLACGSHNIRSIASVIEQARTLGAAGRIEFQVLYGMAEPIRRALIGEGMPVRVYAPVGELVPGMAYLVRRLLENTSNESFLRQKFVQGVSIDELLRNPKQRLREQEPAEAAPAGKDGAMTQRDSTPAPFRNTPLLDWTLEENRRRFARALEKVRREFPIEVPVVIEEWRHPGDETRPSVNPNHSGEVVAQVAMGHRGDANRAVRAAQTAFPAWAGTPPSERAQYLLRAAEIARGRRFELAALQVYEVGKNWAEADADVCEAIDFLEYYSREMLRLAEPRKMGAAPGEDSRMFYEPRGVAAVIAPWNFPMAISAGMTSAALVTGNTVVYKPSSESAAVGYRMFEIFQEAGLPRGVLNIVPGPGDEVGDFLVTHPGVSLIAFTGSKDVGLGILQQAAVTSEKAGEVKKMIAEMGGKNAIIIDSDAELDEAMTEVLHSAFGYQGQKCSACSRLVVLEDVYPRVLDRLKQGAESLAFGPVDDPHAFLGAVISKSARENIERYIEIGKQEGELLVERRPPDSARGFFAPIAIFTGIEPGHRLAQEEIFGPVLGVMKVKDFDEALEVANSTSFALTGGVFSRSPANLEKARKRFRVGNLYLNRSCTGAIVERHPFGGFRLSGVGSKAGGPGYLPQFMVPRVVVENTMRRGFAPETASW